MRFPGIHVPFIGISSNQLRRNFNNKGILQIPFHLTRGHLLCGCKVGVQIVTEAKRLESFFLVSKSPGLFSKENHVIEEI